MRLETRWIPLRIARAFIRQHHRRLKSLQGAIFVVGCFEAGRLCGVATGGRPQARVQDNGYDIEITRVATDGTKNACSALHGRCRRVAQAFGFRVIRSKTLLEEMGASMRASGFEEDGLTDGGEWSRPGRQRETVNASQKRRWVKVLK